MPRRHRPARVRDEKSVPVGVVESGRGAASVCLLCTPDASPGDAVLVHSGFVVEALDPGRAVDAVILRAELAEGLSPGAVSVPRPAE